MSATVTRGWLPLTLLCVSTVCVTCASVGKSEQKETLDRILKVEEVPTAEPSEAPSAEATVVAATPTATPTPEVTVAAATPTATPTPAPTIDLPVGVRAKPAPNLQQPARMDLPLPRGVVHSDLFHFINAHADVIATYQPLAEEWKLYARMFTPESNISVDEIAALRSRVRENLARAHWLFAWGVFQASAQLLTQNQKFTLMVDRQQDFIERMNVLVFLMGEMQASGMKTNHRAFLREFYKHVNVKHFKRPMRDRPGKPVGPLNPIQ